MCYTQTGIYFPTDYFGGASAENEIESIGDRYVVPKVIIFDSLSQTHKLFTWYVCKLILTSCQNLATGLHTRKQSIQWPEIIQVEISF